MRDLNSDDFRDESELFTLNGLNIRSVSAAYLNNKALCIIRCSNRP